MRIVPVAYTAFNDFRASRESGYVRHLDVEGGDFPSEMDELAEFAGRACYESWERPNPATATNERYLANILDHGHYSVLEHSSVSFYVEGVSRSLLAELTRHRHLSFSVVSQRYVRMDSDRIVVPPAIEEHGESRVASSFAVWTVRDEFDAAVRGAFFSYNQIADALLANGLPKKKALEAARSVLPNCVDSPMVVTGNLRAWRDVLGKRHHAAADAEIQAFAAEILSHLRVVAPNSVQDIPNEPF